MKKVNKFLKKIFRKRLHLYRLENSIRQLKYDILNDVLLDGKVNRNKVDLFYKYNRRLYLITFFK
jgi:branched-subunit amino acid aminotransferase/4-amino-4-deoxychorismate lyase